MDTVGETSFDDAARCLAKEAMDAGYDKLAEYLRTIA